MTEDEFIKHARAYGYSVIDRVNNNITFAFRVINISTAKIPLSLSLLHGTPSRELTEFIQESQEVTKVMNEVLGR